MDESRVSCFFHSQGIFFFLFNQSFFRKSLEFRSGCHRSQTEELFVIARARLLHADAPLVPSPNQQYQSTEGWLLREPYYFLSISTSASRPTRTAGGSKSWSYVSHTPPDFSLSSVPSPPHCSSFFFSLPSPHLPLPICFPPFLQWCSPRDQSLGLEAPRGQKIKSWPWSWSWDPEFWSWSWSWGKSLGLGLGLDKKILRIFKTFMGLTNSWY